MNTLQRIKELGTKAKGKLQGIETRVIYETLDNITNEEWMAIRGDIEYVRFITKDKNRYETFEDGEYCIYIEKLSVPFCKFSVETRLDKIREDTVEKYEERQLIILENWLRNHKYLI